MSDRQRLGLCQGDCARWYDRLAHELPLSYKVPAISGQGFGMRAKPSKPRPFRRLSTGTIFGSSAIHVAAMSDGCNEHQELAVFNFADDPKIAHAISPQSRQCSVQWLAYSSRPVPIGDTPPQVGTDPLCRLRIELPKRLLGRSRKFNRPDQDR